MHTGKVEGLVKNYMSMIGPVKEIWSSIVNEFPNYKLVAEVKETDPDADTKLEFGFVCEQLKLGEQMTKKLKERQQKIISNGQDYTLWDIFVDAVDRFSDKKYKSDVHAQRRLDSLSSQVFKYAASLSI